MNQVPVTLAVARVEQALAIDEEIYPPDHPEARYERLRLRLWGSATNDDDDDLARNL